MKKIYQELSELIQDSNYNQTSKQKIIVLMKKLGRSIAEERNIEKVIDYTCGAGRTCPETSFDLINNGKLKYTIWIFKDRILKVKLKEFKNDQLVKEEFLDLQERKESEI